MPKWNHAPHHWYNNSLRIIVRLVRLIRNMIRWNQNWCYLKRRHTSIIKYIMIISEPYISRTDICWWLITFSAIKFQTIFRRLFFIIFTRFVSTGMFYLIRSKSSAIDKEIMTLKGLFYTEFKINYKKRIVVIVFSSFIATKRIICMLNNTYKHVLPHITYNW